MVCLSVCHDVSPAKKMAEPIEMPFRMWTRVGLRNHILDAGPDPTREEELLGENGVPL